MATVAHHRKATPRPCHRDVEEPALRVRVLALRRPLPAAIEDHHVVEFEPLGTVCSEEEQAALRCAVSGPILQTSR